MSPNEAATLIFLWDIILIMYRYIILYADDRDKNI